MFWETLSGMVMQLLRWIQFNGLIAVTYCVLTMISLLLRPEGFQFTLFTPSVGFALAVFIYSGWRFLPTLVSAAFASAFLLQWITYFNFEILATPILWLETVVSLGHAMFGAWLIRRIGSDTQNFYDAKELLKIIVVAGPIGAAITFSATFIGYLLVHPILSLDFVMSLFLGWAGQSLGVFVVYPISAWIMHNGFYSWAVWRSPMVLQFGLACLIAVFVFSKVNQWEVDRYHNEFEDHAQHVVDEFRHVIDKESAILYGAKGLFVASNFVSKDEFDLFARQVLSNNDTIAALEWIPNISHEQRQAFLNTTRNANGMPNFNILEKNPNGDMVVAGERERYFPVYYVYPLAGNERAQGYDLASNPERRQTILQAVASGSLTASPPLRLVQGNNEIAILIFAPVYLRERGSSERATSIVDSLEGLVLGIFRVENVISPVLRRNDTQLPLQIKDINDDKIIYESVGFQAAANTKLIRQVDLLGRSYAISLRLSQDFVMQRQNLLLILLSLIGFLILGIFTLFLLVRTRRGEFTEKLVQEQTQQLRDINRDIQLKNELLDRLADIQSDFINSPTPNIVYRRMTADLLKLTASQLAFIVEVEYSSKYLPILRLLAARGCIDSNDLENVFDIPDNQIFENFQYQLQAALHTDTPYIELNFEVTIDNLFERKIVGFIAIPIYFGFEVAGLIGLARRSESYDKSTVELLEPYTGTCSTFIHASRVASARRKAEAYLLEQESRLRAQFDNANDTIISFDQHGIIESVNPAGEELSAYAATGLVGKHIALVLPEYWKQTAQGKDGISVSSINGLCECFLHNARAELVPVEISTNLIDVPGETLFCSVIRDLSERQKVNRMKNEFVATVSHELRTPLTSIQGSLKLVNSGILEKSPEKQKEMLRIAQNNADRLLLLVNDLLDMEKIESGKLELFSESMDLIATLKQAQLQMESYAQKFDVKLILLDHPEHAMVRADPNRLAQIIANLMSNAIKFTDKNTRVELRVEELQDFYRLLIRDYGPGISEKFKSRLFEKFTQADGSSSRKQAGSGLGLSITKSLIDLMGGQIAFENLNPGAVFYIDLPKENVSHSRENVA